MRQIRVHAYEIIHSLSKVMIMLTNSNSEENKGEKEPQREKETCVRKRLDRINKKAVIVIRSRPARQPFISYIYKNTRTLSILAIVLNNIDKI